MFLGRAVASSPTPPSPFHSAISHSSCFAARSPQWVKRLRADSGADQELRAGARTPVTSEPFSFTGALKLVAAGFTAATLIALPLMARTKRQEAVSG